MILNLTQHQAVLDQIEAGVIEPDDASKEAIRDLLTFKDIPSVEEIRERALSLAEIAEMLTEPWVTDFDGLTMIGGAPFLMAALEEALDDKGLTPVYAFSRRESSEVDDGNGGVRKVAVFRHLGFVGVM